MKWWGRMPWSSFFECYCRWHYFIPSFFQWLSGISLYIHTPLSLSSSVNGRWDCLPVLVAVNESSFSEVALVFMIQWVLKRAGQVDWSKLQSLKVTWGGWMVWDIKEPWTRNQKVWDSGLGPTPSAAFATSLTSDPAPGRWETPRVCAHLSAALEEPPRSCVQRACARKKHHSDSLAVLAFTSCREHGQYLVMVFICF